jgi:hypothetical protein
LLGGLDHFISDLPKEACFVMSGKALKIYLPTKRLPNSQYSTVALYLSLNVGETKLCKCRLRHNDVKLSLEVASTLTGRPIRHPTSEEHFMINTWLSVPAMALAVITAFDPRGLHDPVRHGAATYALDRVTTSGGGVF